MEHLIETCPNKLWPFSSDKRMLFAIYAHFNTMIKREKTLDIAAPISQKLHKICTHLKSLIQVITGMTKIEPLEFELPTLLTNNNQPNNSDIIVKKKRKKKRRSQTHGNKMDHVVSHTRDSIKQNKNPSKPTLVKSNSQKVIIYEHQYEEITIIEDYNENKSRANLDHFPSQPWPYKQQSFDNFNHQYAASFDAVNAASYRRAINQRNDLSKIVHRPHPKPATIDPVLFVEPLHSNIDDYIKQRQPPPPAGPIRKPSVPPIIKSIKPPTLKQISLNLCVEQYKISRDGNDNGLIIFFRKYLALNYLDRIFGKYGIRQIANINELTNVLTVSIILYKAKVFQINSNEKGIQDISKAKIKSIAECLASWIAHKYGNQMEIHEEKTDLKCIELTPKDFHDKIPDFLKQFVDENKTDIIRKEELFNAEPYEEYEENDQYENKNQHNETNEEYNNTENIIPPPLPRKSDKTVTLQTVYKTWKQRRQRPLPKPK